MSDESTASDDQDVTSETTHSKPAYHGSNSVWLTAGIIVADVVGAGILGMPRAVARFGWALGAVVMVVLLAANVHISILMWKVRVGCAECDGARTYLDLCRGAFAKAPAWQQRTAACLTGWSQYSFLFGLLGIYLLSAGKGLGMLFFRNQLCLPVWSALAALLLWPFAGTAREMGSYQSLVWINIITLCGTVLIPLGYYTVAGAQELERSDAHWYAVSPLTVTGVLSGLSTYTFGMTSQFMLAEIISEMKDPMQLPKAYATLSAPFQLTAFLVAGLGGYYWMGDKSAGMMNENLPFNAAFQVASTCLVIHMLISYLIKGVVFCMSILKKAKPQYAHPHDSRKRTLAAWNAVVLLVLFAAWLIANLVPFFGDAVDLLGASLTPISCWIIPIMMFVRYYMDAGENRPRVSSFEWVCIVGELLLAVLLMIFGTFSSIVTLMEHWHTYGPPFDCHCEGIWNTCECSADHIGMDMCSLIRGEVPTS